MALTRKFLAALGIESEKIDEIISAHVESTDTLKAQIAESKDAESKLATVTAELEQVKKDLATANTAIETAKQDDYKGKYETATAELEKIKAEAKAKETASAKRSALKDELKKIGYSDRATNLILRNGFAEDVTLSEDGKANNLDSVIKSIQADSDFSSFTPKVSDNNFKIEKPPVNNGGAKTITKEEIMNIKNTADRQKAIAENPELFGLPANN